MSAIGTRRPKAAPPRRLDLATAADLGVPVFHGIRCACCKAGLHDSEGNPRWEVVGGLGFVCAGGCRPVRRPGPSR